MDEFDKTRLELLAKLAEQLASLQRECSELRRELDEHIKVQQEEWTQLAALKAKYDQLCRERDDFRKALEEQLSSIRRFALCPIPTPNISGVVRVSSETQFKPGHPSRGGRRLARVPGRPGSRSKIRRHRRPRGH